MGKKHYNRHAHQMALALASAEVKPCPNIMALIRGLDCPNSIHNVKSLVKKLSSADVVRITESIKDCLVISKPRKRKVRFLDGSDIGKSAGDLSFLGFVIDEDVLKAYVCGEYPEHLLIDNRFPTGYRRQQLDRPTKGDLGGRCNVNACQRENSAYFYNRVMHKYYCFHCSKDIADANRDMGPSLYANWPNANDL